MKNNNTHSLRASFARVSHLAIAVSIGVSVFGASAVHAQEKKNSEKATEVVEASETVIVTGVLASTKAKKANVSYSVITEEDINRFTPISADDLLRDMPGVIVESNDGVARNEVFTRGMVIGTGTNTTGYFWSTILEDGLPTVPFKFSGFQDGYFYRSDISTNRVEGIKGGSSSTGVQTAIGSTFNYLSGKIKPGASLQTKIGFEGEESHLSWKQIDGYYGWLNKARDFGFSASGFYRTSNGQANSAYDINVGGQFKLHAFKAYTTDSGATGSFNVTIKHLDDTNGELTAFFMPAYGYENPQDMPGFGRDVDFNIKGNASHLVPNYGGAAGTYRESDPTAGYRYKQDAIWLKWDHATAGKWNYTGALRIQTSGVDGNQFKTRDIAAINADSVSRTLFGLNLNNLDRAAGYYEYYNSAGVLQARIANNVAGSQNGIDYRTGLACARVTSTTSAGRCIVLNNLPNSNIDLRGGSVTSTIPSTAAATLGQFFTGVIPSSGSSTDLVISTQQELSERESRDIMGNLTANYRNENLSMNFGLYFAKARQFHRAWASGFGLSAFADGQIENLNVQYVTVSGTRYQLTDNGGWAKLGSGNTGTFFFHSQLTELSPYFGIQWSPGKWDMRYSVKQSTFTAKTDVENWAQTGNGTYSIAAGGVDGNPLTVYDNFSPTLNSAGHVSYETDASIVNYSASIGYNFTPNQKVFYAYSVANQGSFGAINRYQTPASFVRPLGPTASIKEHEAAYIFNSRKLPANLGQINGQVTYFYKDYTINDYPTAIDTDNVTTYLLPINDNIYFTRGVEAWVKWKPTKNLSLDSSVTYANGKVITQTRWLNTGANGLGASDDQLELLSGPVNRSPPWILSNTLSYKHGDFNYSLRHRWMDKRKREVAVTDTRYIPAQDNLDLSVQYRGMKNTRISLDVRNVMNTSYVSRVETMIGGTWPTNVTASDIYNQLPDSATLVRRNAPRSFWLTIKHDF